MIERTSHLAWLCLYWVCSCSKSQPTDTHFFGVYVCGPTFTFNYNFKYNRQIHISSGSMYADQRLPVSQIQIQSKIQFKHSKNQPPDTHFFGVYTVCMRTNVCLWANLDEADRDIQQQSVFLLKRQTHKSTQLQLQIQIQIQQILSIASRIPAQDADTQIHTTSITNTHTHTNINTNTNTTETFTQNFKDPYITWCNKLVWGSYCTNLQFRMQDLKG